MQTIEQTKLYSIPQAADVLGVSHRWVLRALESGSLVGIKVAKNAQLRISGAELMRLTRPRSTASAN
jgi:excisionase family DNA binding protein